MNVADFLADLERRRVRVRAEGDRLHCVAADGVLTDDLIGRIREHKDEIVHHLHDQQTIPRAERTGPLPLSFAQERLWLLGHLDPDDSAYHLPLSTVLCGPLAVVALGQALAEVVRRHEVLRTSYPTRRGRPCQEIGTVALAVPVVDLGGLPEDAMQRVSRRLTEAEARRPFDLAAGPVVRTVVLRRHPTEHRLLLTRHHIASDGWSFGVLGAELSTLYGAFRAGVPSPLPPLPIHYADFAQWQRQLVDSGRLDAKLQAWASRLERVTPSLGFVDDRSRGYHPPRPVGRLRRVIDADLSERLRRAARAAGTTVFAALVSALGVAAAAASDAERVIVGSPSAGRTRPELEPLIGSFATMLPLAVDVSGDPTFAEVMRRVHAVLMSALDVQDLPQELVIDRMRPGRGVPLFSLVFTYQNTPPPAVALPGLDARTEEPVAVAPKFPITVTATVTGGSHDLLVEFDQARAHPAVVAGLVDRFLALLGVASGQSNARCAALVREVAANQPARTARPIDDVQPGPTTLAKAFTAVAVGTPDSTALTFAGSHVTYGALHKAARRVARRLTASGVGADSVVGVCAGPSVDVVVAIVGCTLAGGAYLPLDPDDPPARHEAVMADAGVATIITTGRLADRFAWFDGPVVHTEAPAAGDDRMPVASAPDLVPAHLAYVIYTSGSTGSPKGVMASHGNVCHLFAAADARFDFSSDDTWTLAHSTAFDFSVWEMWGALRHGARLVVLPREVVLDPVALWRTVRDEQVTVLSSTPGAFDPLARAALDDPADPPLRFVVFGGERCDPGRLRPWLDRLGDQRPHLVNMYGITETTVHVTHRRLGADDAQNVSDSPIGSPLPGAHASVVDRYGAPVPTGGQGELLVGGFGLARGYLGQPGVTADRFRPDALGGEPGARVYSSGDVVRVLPDGGLGYLGRLDNQVKLRGYRVEPGEVEAALAGHPDLTAAAVMMRRDGSRTCLAGYVVPTPGVEVSGGQLRRFLGERLPAHLVPAVVVMLERLPLTRNGKVDYAALPPPGQLRSSQRHDVPPTTPTERALARMWAELLGIEPVESIGAHDNFFDLGGDSLLVTRLHARLPAAFGVDLPMRRVYQALDIVSLAAAIDALRQEEVAEAQPTRHSGTEHGKGSSYGQSRSGRPRRTADDGPGGAPTCRRSTGDDRGRLSGRR